MKVLLTHMTRERHNVNKTILGSLVAAGLALAACSSDDTGSAETSASGASSTTVATEPDTTEPDTTETTTTASSTAGLDASFGTKGLLASPLSATDDDRFISIAEGPDGSLYASGFTAIGDDHAFAVSRFDATGKLDPTFGDAGVAVVNVAVGGAGAEVGRGIVVGDDGSVLVAGPFEHDPAAAGAAAKDLDVAIVRLDKAGKLDATFGTGGIAKIDVGAGKAVDAETYLTDNAWGLTARDGGYAVFTVTPNQAADRTDVDYAIVGLTEAGALDTSFGTTGKVVVDLDASGDSARNIGTQTDGKILATGYSRDGDGVVSPVLIRASSDGKLDETFGDGGVANHVVLPGVTESYQWASQGDDYILAGYGRGASADEKVDMVVYRFLADGSLDETFGTDGVTRLDLAGHDDRARNLTILPDGSILAVGSGMLDAANIDGLVVMLDADGAPVESFGDKGHLLVDLGGPADAFFGVTVTKDKRAVLLAGFKGADPKGTENDDALLARIAV